MAAQMATGLRAFHLGAKMTALLATASPHIDKIRS